MAGRVVCFLGISGLVPGCGIPLTDQDLSLFQKHLLAFDSAGTPLRPYNFLHGWRLGTQTMTLSEYQEQLKAIREEIGRFVLEKRETGKECKGVLVFIHGGLNSYGDTERRILERAGEIKDYGYYPIYIAWNSHLISSYWENLLYTQGRFDPQSLIVSPYLVAKDLAVGAMDIPHHAYTSLLNTYERIRNAGPDNETKMAASIAQAYESQYASYLLTVNNSDKSLALHPPIPFSMGSMLLSGFPDRYKYTPWLRLIPEYSLQLGTYFAIDAFGKGAWEGMLRRIRRLFEKEADLQEATSSSHGLTLLMEELRRVQASFQRDDKSQRGPFKPSEAQIALNWVHASLKRLLQRSQDPTYHEYVDRFLALLYKRFSKDPKQLSNSVNTMVELMKEGVSLLDQKKTLIPDDMLEIAGFLASLLLPSGQLGDVSDKIRPAFDALNKFLPILISALAAHPELRTVLFDRLKDVQVWLNLTAVPRAAVPPTAELREKLMQTLHDAAKEGIAALEVVLTPLRRNELPVHIIAHSMGAIVVNEILDRSQEAETPDFKEIVFLAAACTVKDYEEITLRYLARMRVYGTKLYHVVLHPEAERLENMAYDVLPRGSLLVYIDNYLTSPATPRDKTVGRFESLMLALPQTPVDVREQLSVKVMSAGSETEGRYAYEDDLNQNAEEHSGFTPKEFWKSDFYQVNPVKVLMELKQRNNDEAGLNR